MHCIDADFKLFAKVGRFPVADVLCAGNEAVVRLADAVIAAIFARMKIGIAVWAHSAKTDLHVWIWKWLMAFPAHHCIMHSSGCVDEDVDVDDEEDCDTGTGLL